MQKIHIIYDLYYMFYRYKFTLAQSNGDKVRKGFSLPRKWHQVDGELMDVSYLYYTIRGIETELNKYRADDVELTVSICTDSYTDRKENSDSYKNNREGKFTEYDRYQIALIENLFKEAGYNVYKEYNAEADDLVKGLVDRYHSQYDKTYIYTGDADLLINLKSDVYIQRFKVNLGGHILITPENFSEVMGKEYKCKMPYNCIALYKALCGDTSDNISGVAGFGPKTFEKLINLLERENFQFELLVLYSNVEKVIRWQEKFITMGSSERMQQALDSLSLVQNKEVESVEDEPVSRSMEDSYRMRQEAYGHYGIIMVDNWM